MGPIIKRDRKVQEGQPASIPLQLRPHVGSPLIATTAAAFGQTGGASGKSELLDPLSQAVCEEIRNALRVSR
jgi:hypothetical protein